MKHSSNHESTSAQQELPKPKKNVKIDVPPELKEILINFTVNVLVNQPENIVEFAADYFDSLKRKERILALERENQSKKDNQILNQKKEPEEEVNQTKKKEIQSQQSKVPTPTVRRKLLTNKEAPTSSATQEEIGFDEIDINIQSPTTSSQQQERKIIFKTEQFYDDNNQTTLSGAKKNSLSDKDNDDDDDEPYLEPPIIMSNKRRASLWVESYDPETDTHDEKEFHAKSAHQRDLLERTIKDIFIFRNLDEYDISDLLDAMFQRRVKKGEVIIQQGDEGDNFYVVERGLYDISVSGVSVGEYRDDGSFGELALLYNQPRAATIRAETDGSLWAMSRLTFRRIVLKRAHQKRKEYSALIESVEMLASLNENEKMLLSDAMQSKSYSIGQMIIREGDIGDGMFFVVEGRVSIVKDGQQLCELGKGMYFGELSLITHQPRAASVLANSDHVSALFVDVNAFERLLGPCMSIMARNVTHYEQQLEKIFGKKKNGGIKLREVK